MERLRVAMAMAVIYSTSALGSAGSASQTTSSAAPRKEWATEWTTAGSQGQNLNGKMFTLSYNGGGVSFYPPSYFTTSSPWTFTTTYPSPRSTRTRPYTTRTRPYTTHRPYTTSTRPYPTSTYPSWTTAPPTRGVSVCLRYLSDFTQSSTIFTLSPSSSIPLRLTVSNRQYRVTFGRYGYYGYLDMRPDIWFWPDMRQDIWTRFCLTVDTVKNVAQVFSGPNISIRKILPTQYVWSGEPVLDFTGFDGQVTDVQVWDYPLRSRDIFNYMSGGVYGPYHGSVLTWSSIGYSLSGQALLEDTYDGWQKKHPIRPRGRGRPPKGGKMKRLF